MPPLLAEGSWPYFFAFWVMNFFILLCPALVLLALGAHVRKNKLAKKLSTLENAYDDLVKAVRFGRATDDDIKRAVRREDFPAFQRFLENRISSVDDFVVGAERRVADVSGFTDHLRKRIRKTRGWDKSVAVRLLANFRDPGNISLFREILGSDTFVQTLYAAGLGLALSRDQASAAEVGRRLWRVSGGNRDALLLILRIYGKDIAPQAIRALEDDAVDDDLKPAVLDYLAEIQCREAAPTLERMLDRTLPGALLERVLNALRWVGAGAFARSALPFLGHARVEARIEAVAAVAELGGPGYLPSLERSMSDENGWVRRAAAEGMARTGQAGLSHLQALAGAGEPKARAAAKTILAELRFNRLTGVAS